MFSKLPDLANRAFILGFLVPTLVLLLGLGLVLWDQPQVAEINRLLGNFESLEKAILAVAFVWVVAIALMMLNVPLLRLLEGYVGPLAGDWFAEQSRLAYKKLHCKFKALNAAWLEQGEAFPAEQRREHNRLKRKLVTEYPPEAHLLPTRLGNAIRSFETYPGVAYGAESIVLWPHLLAVAADAFVAAADDARAQLDCLANLVFVGLLLALIAAVRLAWSGFGFGWPSLVAFGPNHTYAIVLVLGLIGMWIAYRMAIDRAIAWGWVVRAMFDCYLPKLAAQLGYEAKDVGRTRDFWDAASRRLLYREAIDAEAWAKLQPAAPPPHLPFSPAVPPRNRPLR